MRIVTFPLVLALALASSLFVAAAPAQDQKTDEAKTVTFKRATLRVGDTITQASKSNSSSTSERSMNGEEAEPRNSKTSRSLKKKTEVMAMTADKVSAIRVTYTELERETARPQGNRRRGGGGRPGGNERAPMADEGDLVGKTYTLTLKDGRVIVTGADGKEVKPEIAGRVKRLETRDAKFRGFGPDVSDLIPAGEMKIGHRIEIPSARSREFMSANSGRSRFGRRGGRGGRDGQGGGASPAGPKVSLILEDTTKILGRATAVFRIEVVMPEPGADREGMTLDIESKSKGKFYVGLEDSRPYRVDFENETSTEMSFETDERSMEMSSESKRKSQTMWIYSKVKKAAKS
ncbi:MAG: hypothetical protein V3W41_11040 [Planctomycetota bacterium]